MTIMNAVFTTVLCNGNSLQCHECGYDDNAIKGFRNMQVCCMDWMANVELCRLHMASTIKRSKTQN